MTTGNCLITDTIENTIPVLYQDNHLLVVNKPRGMLVQGDRTGDRDLLTICKQYIKERYRKPGKVFLGLVHRLDRPVSGVIVLARTSKAAARLSAQIRERRVTKNYLALVAGVVPEQGDWRDRMSRRGPQAVMDPAGKEARLHFQREAAGAQTSLVRITLITGRHHQIRLQFADRGFPLLGDFRYGGSRSFTPGGIALHAASFSCLHPTSKEELTFTFPPDEIWQEQLF
ncbi:RluA family pseudouridine synthase [Desulfogranum mediterraneum]|uniref:RluA family pseudouridine synthase n=1 Tax=Desulfogranum mediterraneum TaxID=160661 RepID=UPI00137691F7|nr:RNA pseudouridine synthase [Desulfogranum mediterraneum]